jgi:hypothetical protein
LKLKREFKLLKFNANENYDRHVANMDYTRIQNAKAKAIENRDWDALTELDLQEAQMVK